MPMAVGQNVTKLWIYGEGMCMLHAYFQGVSVSASIFTITAMSIDRYLAIRHPMAFRKVFNRKSTIVVIIALWVVSTLLFAPLLWVQRTQEPAGLTDMLPANNALDNGGLKICIEDWDRTPFSKKVYGVFLFTLVYAIPGTVVMVAYTLMGRRLCAVKPPFDENSTAGSASSQQGSRLVRERRRVARILLVLAVLFAMCWLPYNVNILVIDLLEPEDSTMPMHALTRVLTRGHCNSAINPLLYCFMTRNFRRTVRGLFTRRRARPLGTRPQQRCKIRACPRTASATSSSGYDSYHSPHRRCYVLKLHTLRDSRATAESGSAASASYPAGSGSSTRLTRLHHHCHHHLAPQQLQQTTTSMEQRYL
ncbi:hypothetical protein ONE63_004965 [Megalurothrips usitatus]|uniref:G-protein coupled receptors family 1 profile domain-containing protein n=1 Tax=Megalurothrips usitatus TaxID=439358 RepID=A0AAV7X6V1_9NEOP|nr:hypothetical protein ONE63_004965 [Megalurothrips usitatus]